MSSEAERGPAGSPRASRRARRLCPSTWASMGASDDASRPRRARRRARSPVASVRCASDSPSRAASRDAGGFVGAPSTRCLRCRGVAPRASSPARMAVRRLARACVRPPRTTINETSGRFSHLPRLGPGDGPIADFETAFGRRHLGRATCREVVMHTVKSRINRCRAAGGASSLARDHVRRRSSAPSPRAPAWRAPSPARARRPPPLASPPWPSPPRRRGAVNIVVVGGTGGTGAECVVQALKRGAKVTVLARTPSKMVQPPGSGGADEGKPSPTPT